VLYQNDDLGKDYLNALEEKLGGLLVSKASYETTAPTVDTQILLLKNSGADVLLVAATPKFAAQAIRKTAEIEWKPTVIISNVRHRSPAFSSRLGATIRQASSPAST
jgi:branched-chain amino acid transport system substrate-binding protein